MAEVRSKLSKEEAVQKIPITEEKRQPIREVIAEDAAEKARAAWKAKWRSVGYEKAYPHTNWLGSKTINVFRMPGVDEETARFVVDVIEKFKQELGLDFKVVMGNVEAISPLVEASMEKGRFGCRNFWNRWYDLCDEGDGKRTAALFLLNSEVVEKETDRAIYGWSDFSASICALTRVITKSKDKNFIEKAVRHEMGHLLGYFIHHDTGWEGIDLAHAYPHVDDCLMLWVCTTPKICPKCSDAIKAFWSGIEAAYTEKDCLRELQEHKAAVNSVSSVWSDFDFLVHVAKLDDKLEGYELLRRFKDNIVNLPEEMRSLAFEFARDCNLGKEVIDDLSRFKNTTEEVKRAVPALCQTKANVSDMQRIYLAMQGKFSEERLDRIVKKISALPEGLRQTAYSYFVAEGYDSLMAITSQEFAGLNDGQVRMKAEQRANGRIAGLSREWFHEKKIFIYYTQDADMHKVDEAVKGIRRLFDYLGIDFTVIEGGSDPIVSRVVETSVGKDGSVDKTAISDFTRALPPLAAKLMVIGKPLPGVLEGVIVRGDFNFAAPVSWLSPRFSPPGRITQQEVMHCFEVPEHTGLGTGSTAVGTSGWKDYLDSDYANEKMGYKEDTNCLMVSYLPKSDKLCDKCHDMFVYFWKGVEETSGVKIFK